MYSDWQAEAKKQIALVDRQFEAGTSWQERQTYLRKAAWFFHGGTSWGKRVWAKHCRAYLESHGKPPRKVPEASAPLFASDITFPFRPSTDGEREAVERVFGERR